MSALLFTLIFPLTYFEIAEKHGESQGVETALILAVIQAESGGRADAESHKGAMGLMQLLPSTAEWLSEREGISYHESLLFDPDFNVMLGARYLAYLSERFDGEYILSAYNAGEGITRSWLENGGAILYAETREYVFKVKLFLRCYRLRLKLRNILW